MAFLGTRGRLQTYTYPDGASVSIQYLDRVTMVTYEHKDEQESIRFRYRENGREMGIIDASGEVVYRLHLQERVIERQDIFGNTVRYTFTPEGHLQSLTYPDGKVVVYDYDANGNLTYIRDFAGHETHIEYDENDLPIKVIHPGGFMTLYEYDLLDRVVHICHLDTQGNVLVEQHIQRDATGRVLSMKVNGRAVEHLSSLPDARLQRQFTFNELGQIVATDEGPFQYDDRGNLLSYIDDKMPVTLRYDLRDRLVEAWLGDTHLRYAYDPENNRVAVTRNNVTRRYVLDTVLDLPRPLVEMDEKGQPVYYFIWGQGLQYVLDAQGQPRVYLFNHRGDTLAVVDTKGQVLAAYVYAPYGQVIGYQGNLEEPFRFLGRWGIMTDHEGLVYIRSRYYAPRLGVFTQPDRLHIHIPLPRFLNRYAYALDEPWDLVDIDGRFAQVLVGSVVGGVIGLSVELGLQSIENVARHGLNFGAYQFDTASLVGATVGGAVSGALYSTGLGAIPVVGGAIASGVGGVTHQAVENMIKGKPLTEGVFQRGIAAAVGGAAADILHQVLGKVFHARMASRNVVTHIAPRHPLDHLSRKMETAWTKALRYERDPLRILAAPWKTFWRLGIRRGLFIHSLMTHLLDGREWLSEVESQIVEKAAMRTLHAI